MGTNFFFDYIYYRITKAYFKWDGKTGATGIVGVSLFQFFLLIDIFAISTRTVLDRYFFKPYVQQVTLGFCLIMVIIVFFNYRKYNGSYNKLRNYWKDESDNIRVMKGFLVVLSFLLPLIPLIVIAIFS